MKTREFSKRVSSYYLYLMVLCRAEFMLEVTGAGAAATSKQDWHRKWIESVECQQLQNDIDHIHCEGRNRPPIAATTHSEFAAPWIYQVQALLIRNFTSYWRSPIYLLSKLSLSLIGGL